MDMCLIRSIYRASISKRRSCYYCRSIFSHPFLFLVAASVPREIENYRSNIIMEMGQKWGASFTRISRFISLKVKNKVGWE